MQEASKESVRDNPSSLYLLGQQRRVQKLQAGCEEASQHSLPEGAVSTLQAAEATEAPGVCRRHGEHHQQGAAAGESREAVH